MRDLDLLEKFVIAVHEPAHLLKIVVVQRFLRMGDEFLGFPEDPGVPVRMLFLPLPDPGNCGLGVGGDPGISHDDPDGLPDLEMIDPIWSPLEVLLEEEETAEGRAGVIDPGRGARIGLLALVGDLVDPGIVVSKTELLVERPGKGHADCSTGPNTAHGFEVTSHADPDIVL